MQLPPLATPALVVDAAAFAHNVATMAAARPGTQCRPHVKAFKSTALAQQLHQAGHVGFCAATPREIVGMAAAGLDEDLLLANQCLDPVRLAALAGLDAAVTVAVDSDQTVDAAITAGITAVLIDVNVGLARCGCAPSDAGRLAERARAGGLDVRGVMGYEGHLMGLADRASRQQGLETAMAGLLQAHAAVGGQVVSGGGTGTYDLNRWVTEIQAGSYTLLDTAYAKLDLPFRQALAVAATVISTGTTAGAERSRRYFVADVGLKALGMDHGLPELELADNSLAKVWFCSDEHITFSVASELGHQARPEVGSQVAVRPAHVDPTVAYHERFVVVANGSVVDEWAIDLRGW